MKQIIAITKKELEGYFGSLLAVIFLGTFLIATLFVFFSIEKFFARGIADVRPMFQWMPVLMIFLLAALTMRQWSEEQRSGTLEVIMTLPVKQIDLVLGKFFAVMTMMLIALAMTLPLPIVVSLLGNLDWGPVFGGYLAAVLMAGAYAAIGLFVSSRTDNQIVALISTILLGGLFYLVGTTGFTSLFDGSLRDIFRAIGTGSRFESIQRGVIDLRDLVYYLSLTAIFLFLNVLSLDSKRWSRQQKAYRNHWIQTSSLVMLNLVLVNVWMYPLRGLRLDLTQQKEFTISKTTRDLISGLSEPLTITAYLSTNTHPLLAPLLPQVSDMLREYEIASGGKVVAEVIDPIDNPDVQAEIYRNYGISPTPFQISGVNQASIVNAYFDILVHYGDQSILLNFQDLIEISQTAGGSSVKLKNLEYDLTGAIKKVVYGFQSVDSVLAASENPVNLTLYVTNQNLPQSELPIVQAIQKVAGEIQTNSNGKFIFMTIDLDSPGSPVTRDELTNQYGIEPYPVSLFSEDTYFFHMVLQNGENRKVIYPPTEANEAEIKTSIESAIKQTSKGFLKVVGFWTPPSTPTVNIYGQSQQPLSSYNYVQQQLGQDYTVQTVDLTSGKVASNIDVLVMIAPQNLTELELFAVDQYLMRGGSVVIATNPYKIDVDPYEGVLALTPIDGGLKDLLASYGVNLGTDLVMDQQNSSFPVVVNQNVSGQTLQQLQAVPYPFFVDVRQEGLNKDSLITGSLTAVDMDWVSPVSLDETLNMGRETAVLLNSSANSWTTGDSNIQPDFETYPELGFPQPETLQSSPLAVSVTGSFTSYFKGKAAPTAATSDGTTTPATDNQLQTAVVEQSPASSRLVVIGSTGFIDDFALQLAANLTGSINSNNLNFFQNAVDWSVEDVDLLSIRSRGAATRVLVNLSDNQYAFFQGLTYGITLLILAIVVINWRLRRKKEKPMQLIAVENQSRLNKNERGG